MMIVGDELPKQPDEAFPWSVDFASEIVVGETIAQVVFTATKESDGSDATSVIALGSAQIFGTTVAQRIQAGAHGVNYWLELEITTSLGHVWQAERRLVVRAVPEPIPPP